MTLSMGVSGIRAVRRRGRVYVDRDDLAHAIQLAHVDSEEAERVRDFIAWSMSEVRPQRPWWLWIRRTRPRAD